MMLTQAAAVSGLNALAAAGGGQEGGVEGLLGSVGSGSGGAGGGYRGLPLSTGQSVPSHSTSSTSTTSYSIPQRSETFPPQSHPLRVFQPFPGPQMSSVGSTLPPASSFPPPPPRYQQQSTSYSSQAEVSSAWGSSLESYGNGGIDTFPPRQQSSTSTSTESASAPGGVLFETLLPPSPLDPQSGPAAPVPPPPPPEEVGASLSKYIETNGRFPPHIPIDTISNQKASPPQPPPPTQSSSTTPPTRQSTTSSDSTTSSRKYAAFSGPSPCWWPTAPPSSSSANPLAIRETEETSPSNDDLQDLLWPGYPPHLPTPGMMERCVETFFNKCPMANHLLHRGRFISRLSLPPTHETYPHPAVLHAILAVAAFYLGGEIYLIPAAERGLMPNLLERSKRNKNGLSSDRRPVWDGLGGRPAGARAGVDGDFSEVHFTWARVRLLLLSLALSLFSLEISSSKAAQELKPALLFFVWVW